MYHENRMDGKQIKDSEYLWMTKNPFKFFKFNTMIG